MLCGIQAHAALRISSRIAKVLGGKGMGGFVEGNREQYWQCVHRNHLDEIVHWLDFIRGGTAAGRILAGSIGGGMESGRSEALPLDDFQGGGMPVKGLITKKNRYI